MQMRRKRRALSHQARKLGRIERDVLQDLTLGDLLYAHLVSGRSIRRFYRVAQERAVERYRRKQAITRLKKDGFLLIRGNLCTITRAGSIGIGAQIDKTRALLKGSHWNGKWYMAVYDIPEELASLRREVRRMLKKAGFVKLQNSIWIFPYPCDELVQLIKRETRLTPYILYGILEHIENGNTLKKRFGLR